jgi:carbamate kinase
VRIVAAVGGNALLRRGERADEEVQLRNLAAAVPALAALGRSHELILTHGNGPQVGLLAAERNIDPRLSAPYPLDTLGAETQGMIGYWLVRELRNAMPSREVAAVVTQTLVNRDDPAFGNPTKFVGPVYDEEAAHALAYETGWEVRRDGPAWRRVVPSPEPVEIIELPIIRRLIDSGVLVVAAGGGGIPVARTPQGQLVGVEAVVDKDLAAAHLAAGVKADMLLLLTDVDAVYRDWGTPDARPIRTITVDELLGSDFPAGSMGPKIAAAVRFLDRTGGKVAIGALSDALALASGETGTTIVANPRPLSRSARLVAG